MAEQKIAGATDKRDPAQVAKKEAQIAKNKERNERRERAWQAVKALIDASGDAKGVKALTALRPSLYGVTAGRGPGGGGPSIFTRFVAYVQEKKTVSETDVFKEFKIGRKEANNLLRVHLRRAEPASRVWVAFAIVDGLGQYTVSGTGANAPKGWTGFVPVEASEQLK